MGGGGPFSNQQTKIPQSVMQKQSSGLRDTTPLKTFQSNAASNHLAVSGSTKIANNNNVILNSEERK